VRVHYTAPGSLIGRIAEVTPHDELGGALLAQL